MIQLLNEDLAGEYQAIIAYTVYSQVLKGAAYTDIARELEAHAGEELAHAIKIAKQIDYLGGMPGVTPKPVKTSNDPVEMLRADLENERATVGRYRERIRQAEAMGEFALSETLRAIIVQEQEHEIDLSAALGIDVPPAIKPDVKKWLEFWRRIPMPQGDKSSYTDKQKRQAEHIEAGYEKKASARKPRKHGLGPPSTNSPAAAKRAAPAGRKPN
jgi:bacterioferritin